MYKMYTWRKKGALGSIMELRPKFKEINRLNEIKGVVSNLWGKIHPAKLPTCEKELKKSLSSKGNHQNHKAYTDVIEQGASACQPKQAAEPGSFSHTAPALEARIQDR